MTPSTTLKIQDTTFAGKVLQEISLSFATEIVTVRDIVMARIHQEVATYNEKLSGRFNGLVAPSEAESTLNGYVIKDRRPIDAEKQVYVALDSFQRNGYFVLIDDAQADSLDQQVLLTSDTVVSFIKLTPLVGG